MIPRRALAAVLAGMPVVVSIAAACIVVAASLVLCGAQTACARGDDSWAPRLRHARDRHAVLTITPEPRR